MLVYGINAVIEALSSDTRRIERITIAKGKAGRRLQQIIDQARAAKIPVHFEPEPALERKAGTRAHQSVIAEIAAAELASLDAVLERRPRLLLLVDGVEDPHNLGAVIRTAEAAGVEAVLLPNRHTCGITPAVVKTSAGAALHLPVCRVGNLVQTIKTLKESGFWVVGLDMAGESRFDEIDTSLPLAVVVGGESRGVRRLVRENCDFLLGLPMKGNVSSLNLSVAAGILLYTLRLRHEKLI